MAKRGIRLTCPTCSRSNFYTLDQLRVAQGFLYCHRHARPVRLVDLLEVIQLALKSVGKEKTHEGDRKRKQHA